ncbi:MAG TPA: FABP family protein [Arachnia sp.]|nr:FABP family protein [Arachnia sp.]HMT85513.1 FABP family protein [Arachnia sp.]
MKLDIEVPEGLPHDLIALGWLVGGWHGDGHGIDHNGREFTFEQHIVFQHTGADYLYSSSWGWETDADGNRGAYLPSELAFWKPQADASLEVTLTNSDGWTEVLVGKIQVTRIDLLTDAVVRTASAEVSHSSGQRLYGKVEGDLMYALDRATTDHELRPHMWARLKRVENDGGPEAAETKAG